MDEKELASRFLAAPGEPPPPAFTLDDVTKASTRATARRRSGLMLAAACLVVLLGAAGIAGVTYFRSTESTSAQPDVGPARPAQGFPAPSPLQGSGGIGEDGPRAEGTSGCEKVDRELATALAGELPATGVTGPSPGRVCPTHTRSAAFHVTDGNRSGAVSVTLVPAGVAFHLGAMTDGTVLAEQLATSGGTVLVLSTPDAGSAVPLEGELPHIATALAQHF